MGKFTKALIARRAAKRQAHTNKVFGYEGDNDVRRRNRIPTRLIVRPETFEQSMQQQTAIADEAAVEDFAEKNLPT